MDRNVFQYGKMLWKFLEKISKKNLNEISCSVEIIVFPLLASPLRDKGG